MKRPAQPRQRQELWDHARAAGLSRRLFLAMLASGGAAAVVAACSPKLPSSLPLTGQPQPAVTPTASPERPISKPVPDRFFMPFGANAEMRFEVMARQAYATPNSFFYVRSHAAAPFVNTKTWTLTIQGDGVEKPVVLGYNDLLDLPARTVTRALECAGNGRSFYDSLMRRPATGTQWKLGAYGVAEWTGVPLADLLRRAGIKPTAVDVMPTGMDSGRIERPMPVEKAMEDDTLVAYLMNGDILPVDHGFPARVIVPGWVGIASIKWVTSICVSEKPLYVDKNTNSYVFVGPDYKPQPPAKGEILTTNIMKSACALPWPATLQAGRQAIAGYAWSPFGRISRVDISTDGGKTFQQAVLSGPNIERAGSRWQFSFDATPGEMTITPRAFDEKGNSQYDLSQQRWNEQGYLFGAMVPHPVKVV
ncbi:MAG: sulfite oxidase [Chloroflexi bacterium]|nr:sulfite oxidase [Chloroflexota bacterium]